MIALICLLLPALIGIYLRKKIYHIQDSRCQTIIRYILLVLILNSLILLILVLFFNTAEPLFFKLNHYPKFAAKYFALGIVLSMIELAAQPQLKRAGKIIFALPQTIRNTRKGPVKAGLFIVLVAVLTGVFSRIAQPIWTSWNNYSTMQGFYREPENTIETVFLGSSFTVNGIIPIELYENYGICAYNLGTEQQPLLASYYWAQEAYRLHPKTLDTIVLDVSMLRKNASEAYYHKALDYMQFSKVKFHAVKDYSALFDEEAFINLIPALSYHDRWKDISENDFTKAETRVEQSTRGYHFVTTTRIDSVSSYTSVALPAVMVNEDADELELNTESLYYLKKLICFCRENDIKLVLTKITTNDWNSSAHIAVRKIADENHLDFLDFNYEPYFNELDFNYSFDTVDSHLNYYGASKFTRWIGNYLVQTCGNRDIRGVKNYAFMETEREDYQRSIAKIYLNEITDPVDYLDYLLNQRDYTVFISVKDSASAKLTQEQRDYFASAGLQSLSTLSNRASYLAVLDNGSVIVEMTEEDPGTEEKEEKETLPINDMKHIEDLFETKVLKNNEESEEETLLLEYEGYLQNSDKYKITSGGYNLGNASSITIAGVNYSPNSRGLNIVVYDNKREEVIDHTNFDTYTSSKRKTLDYAIRLQDLQKNRRSLSELSGIDRKLYLYARAAELKEIAVKASAEAGENGLLTYLKAFWDEEECEIYLSVKEDAADALSDEVRDALAKLGLTKLSNLKSGDSYLAVIRKGNVAKEDSSHADLLEIRTVDYHLTSGGMASGNTSSMMINGKEYSNKTRGINIVVFDTETRTVVSQQSFDTGKVPQRAD